MRIARMLGRGIFFGAALASVVASGDAPQLRVDRVSPPAQNFFSKRAVAEKIPIEAHADVPDAAVRAGAERLSRMLAHAPRITANLRARSFELEIAGKLQLISDLPAFRSLRGTIANGVDFDEHTRGGGHLVDRFVACAEGNLLGYVGERQYHHDICIHELAHAVMWVGVSPAVRAVIESVYAKSKSKWASVYAGTNAPEYFAELSMWYFGSSSGQTPTHDSKPGPQWLASYDADGFALLDAIYTDRQDPGSSVVVAALPKPAQDEATTRSIDGRLPVTMTLHNGTSDPLLTYWLDYKGERQQRASFPANADVTLYTYATHAFVVTSLDGRARAVFRAPADDSRGTFTP